MYQNLYLIHYHCLLSHYSLQSYNSDKQYSTEVNSNSKHNHFAHISRSKCLCSTHINEICAIKVLVMYFVL